jgi:hypothetical protein
MLYMSAIWPVGKGVLGLNTADGRTAVNFTWMIDIVCAVTAVSRNSTCSHFSAILFSDFASVTGHIMAGIIRDCSWHTILYSIFIVSALFLLKFCSVWRHFLAFTDCLSHHDACRPKGVPPAGSLVVSAYRSCTIGVVRSVSTVSLVGWPVIGLSVLVADSTASFSKLLEALGPQKALPCARPHRLTNRSSKSAQPFLRGAMTRNEQKKRKPTESLYVDPLWAGPLWSADDEFWPMRFPPNVMNCVELGFDRSRGFGSAWCQFWPICHWQIDPSLHHS